MLFNSFEFLLFFIVVTTAYFTFQHKYRWILLLISSYFFYGYWEIKYLSIIVISTLIDFYIGIKIYESSSQHIKRFYLYISLLSNLGILFVFKYFNFFIENASELIKIKNPSFELPLMELLLPVGISFYTFQTMSYSIDNYNEKIKPERHLGIFALFVTFFPQLVAGPIERASNLLPQFHKKQLFDYDRISNGLGLMLWGLFKKVVIADRLAIVVNEIYNNPNDYNGLTLVVGTIFFAFQIYCDFSGYSDIAIGAARVLGFDLMKNFNYPYFSKSINEFWKRWHISLSTWFRDYVYIPLGGNRRIKWRWYYNLFITFLISGLWHGANWTFIVWGIIHGTILIIETITIKKETSNNKFKNGLLMLKTFIIVCLSWVFFRANNIQDAFSILTHIFDFGSYSFTQLSLYIVPTTKNTVYAMDIFLSYVMIIILVGSEYIFGTKLKFEELNYYKYKLPIYVVGIVSILLFGAFEKNEFIYFQF
ncbi:MAG: MBOAT family protein [Flavobacteriales bacterium]|nr:MBOAT family protein [Flavobacteriales bacterium]